MSAIFTFFNFYFSTKNSFFNPF
ncbi:hypothetical protein [Caldicellulosiruptor saccharolyticus]